MRSVTVRLDDLRTMILNLGFVGENEHRKFNFDCKKMFGEYPSASVSLTVQPPAGDCYPATVERNGDLVSWTVTDSDLIEEGCGEIQLTFMVGDVVAKTCIGRTKVERSLGATGDIPTPIENWIEQAEEVISEAEAATAAAEDAAAHQPIIDDNGYWAVWDADAEEYVATEYKAQGTDGHDGVGIVSIEKTGTSGLVDTYTITFTSGNPVTYTVTNGRDADPTEIIDDNAGSGDTDKVWSADKSSSLLTAINSAEEDIGDIKNLLEMGVPGSVNLFDPQNPNLVSLIPKSGGTTLVEFSGARSVWLQVEPNSIITLDRKTSGNRLHALTFANKPVSGSTFIQDVNGGNAGDTVTVTLGSTENYVLFYLSTDSSCDYSNIRIYYGTEWHDYSPNVIEQINSNLSVLNEKFYNSIAEKNAFNLLSYRPLGVLTKPYIAISCDDGASALATTTIPMFKGYKTTYGVNIPLTMGLMDTSAAINDDSYLALVNEMLADYGCEVATHGGTSYTSYTNDELIEFLDEQESFIEGKCGRKPVGIIYPNHAYNLEKKVIAGSYYGICASGYSQGIYYTSNNGPRSNMYELHRWSLFAQNMTTSTIEIVVDFCEANNMLLLPWFHDSDLTGADASRNAGLLDYLVQYARGKGIDFISFKDILTIK